MPPSARVAGYALLPMTVRLALASHSADLLGAVRQEVSAATVDAHGTGACRAVDDFPGV